MANQNNEAMTSQWIHTFTYLSLEASEDAAHRAPYAWSLELNSLPNHPCIAGGDRVNADVYLCLSKPAMTACPPPPEPLLPWLHGPWDDPAIEPGFAEQIAIDGTAALFTESGLRPLAEEWLRARTAWRIAEQNGKAALRLYDELFSVYMRLKRGEPLELYLGDGRVRQGDVDEPMLLHHMTISFDQNAHAFWLRPIGAPLWNTAPLYAVSKIDRSMLASLRCEYDAAPISPLDGKATASFLRRLSASLRVPIAVSASVEEDVFLYPSPILFLCARLEGIDRLYQQILWRLRSRAPLSQALVALSGSTEEPSAALSDFGMPATLEQRRVNLSSGAMLIEGAPGTGKTYTLANAVFLAMAEGKKLLLTAPDQSTLDAFCRHLPPGVRALCLGMGGETCIESGVDALLERADRNDLLALEEEAKAAERQYALQETATQRARAAYQSLLELESRPIECAGRTFTPYEAASYLRAHGRDAWIPAPVRLSALPLTAEELDELYNPPEPLRANDGDDTQRLVEDLPSPDTFSDWVRQSEAPIPTWWNECVPPDEKKLVALTGMLQQHVSDAEGWEAAIVESALTGVQLDRWQQLHQAFVQYLDASRQPMEVLAKHPAIVPAALLEDEADGAALAELIDAGKRGKITKMALMRQPRWKALLPQIRIGDAEPHGSEQWEAVEARVAQMRELAKLRQPWNALMAVNGAPPLDQAANAPAFLSACCERMAERLAFVERLWTPLCEQFSACGLDLQALVSSLPMPQSAYPCVERLRLVAENRLPEAIHARIHGAPDESSQRFTSLAAYIEPIEGLNVLHRAVLMRDADGYREAYLNVLTRSNESIRSARRAQLLEQLAYVAPNWANEIASGVAPQGDIEDAWLYCQLQAELQHRIAHNVQAQQQTMEEAQARLYQLRAKMYEAQAWLHAARYLTPARRTLLLGWRDAARRARNAHGVRSRSLQEAARKQLMKCAMAAPIWALPLPQVLSTFTEDARFDVVALDEAGGVQLEALPLAALCDTLLMAGDEGQIEWSATEENASPYAAEFLSDVPHMALIEGNASLFEFAQANVPRVLLRAQFRNLPDIAQCVTPSGDVPCVREASRVARTPQTVVLRADASLGDAPEAQTIASLVKAMTEIPEYADASIGVAALRQPDVFILERLLRQHIDEQKIRRHRIHFDAPQGFRGMERDVMLLWIGQGDSRDLAPKLRAATSRARDQLWVVHDLDTDRIFRDDPRCQLIERAQYPRFNASADLDTMTQTLYDRLAARGLDVLPFAGQGAELFIRNGGGALIACEGGRFRGAHRLAERIDAQSTFVRMGWRLLRLSGAQVGAHPKEIVDAIVKRLADWGVTPDADEHNRNQLVEEIITMAESYIAHWRAKDQQEETCADDRIEDAQSLINFLARHGVETVDDRLQTGLFWVVGGAELGEFMEWLDQHGIRFVFSETGDACTGNRAGWVIRLG